MPVLRRQRLLASGVLAALTLALCLVGAGVHQHAGGSESAASCAVCVVAKHAAAAAVSTPVIQAAEFSSELRATEPADPSIRPSREPYAERAPPLLFT
jgi:hypothetical protein